MNNKKGEGQTGWVIVFLVIALVFLIITIPLIYNNFIKFRDSTSKCKPSGSCMTESECDEFGIEDDTKDCEKDGYKKDQYVCCITKKEDRIDHPIDTDSEEGKKWKLKEGDINEHAIDGISYDIETTIDEGECTLSITQNGEDLPEITLLEGETHSDINFKIKLLDVNGDEINYEFSKIISDALDDLDDDEKQKVCGTEEGQLCEDYVGSKCVDECPFCSGGFCASGCYNAGDVKEDDINCRSGGEGNTCYCLNVKKCGDTPIQCTNMCNDDGCSYSVCTNSNPYKIKYGKSKEDCENGQFCLEGKCYTKEKAKTKTESFLDIPHTGPFCAEPSSSEEVYPYTHNYEYYKNIVGRIIWKPCEIGEACIEEMEGVSNGCQNVFCNNYHSINIGDSKISFTPPNYNQKFDVCRAGGFMTYTNHQIPNKIKINSEFKCNPGDNPFGYYSLTYNEDYTIHWSRCDTSKCEVCNDEKKDCVSTCSECETCTGGDCVPKKEGICTSSCGDGTCSNGECVCSS